MFALGCGVIMLVAELLVLVVGNSGWRMVDAQMRVAPFALWIVAGAGVAAGIILALANVLGPWPRLAWRRVAFAYSLFPIGLALFTIACLLTLLRHGHTGVQVHVLDCFQELHAFGHGLLEGFAAGDEAHAAGALIDDGGHDGILQVVGAGCSAGIN